MCSSSDGRGGVETNSIWLRRAAPVERVIMLMILSSIVITPSARTAEDGGSRMFSSRGRTCFGRSNKLPKWRMLRRCPRRPNFRCGGGDGRRHAKGGCGSTRDTTGDLRVDFDNGPPREVERPTEDESETAGNFGRRSYWEESYAEACSGREVEGGGSSYFSWYCTWGDLEPFWRELVPLRRGRNDYDDNYYTYDGPRILIPGIGNDPIVRDMYDAGYKNLSAFDYAPAAVDCARALLGEARLRGASSPGGVRLDVADARDLRGLYDDATFDAVLEKGTLDAVFLIGGRDKGAARAHVRSAVDELRRVVRPGGVVLSITGVDGATSAIDEAFSSSPSQRDRGGPWAKVRDTRDGVYFTEEDGYATINIDATMLAWTRSLDYV